MENAAPRLMFPALRPFYDWAEPVSWALIRITAGLMLIPHGWPKLMMGINATAQMALVKRGIAPAEPLAVALIALETLGGLCIALGLFTRFWAAAVFVEMMVIVYHHLPKFGWTGPGLRVPALLGAGHARHRLTRRRTLLGRPRHRARAVSRVSPAPARCARRREGRGSRW
jgi:putative oxidoreductase